MFIKEKNKNCLRKKRLIKKIDYDTKKIISKKLCIKNFRHTNFNSINNCKNSFSHNNSSNNNKILTAFNNKHNPHNFNCINSLQINKRIRFSLSNNKFHNTMEG